MKAAEPTAADLELFADGALDVNEAVAFTSMSRQQLFALMSDGTLPWHRRNERGDRVIPKRALVRLLATNHAAQRSRE